MNSYVPVLMPSSEAVWRRRWAVVVVMLASRMAIIVIAARSGVANEVMSACAVGMATSTKLQRQMKDVQQNV